MSNKKTVVVNELVSRLREHATGCYSIVGSAGPLDESDLAVLTSQQPAGEWTEWLPFGDGFRRTRDMEETFYS